MTIQRLFEQAQIHHQHQRFTEAERLYQEVLAQNPDHPKANNFLGGLYLQTQNYEQALRFLHQALVLEPDNPYYQFHLGEAYQAAKKFPEALAYYEGLLQKGNPDSKLLRALARTYLEMGQEDLALAYGLKLLKKHPNHPENHYCLSQIYAKRSEFTQAIQHACQLIRFRPEDPELYRWLDHLSQSTELSPVKQVDFIICGVQKGGTTALSRFLAQHPEICFYKLKETYFFAKDKFFKHNNPNYKAYHYQFLKNQAQRVVGEGTPDYIYLDQCIPRIWAYHPQMKLIILLRNPIERAYSNWQMEVKRGKESLSFSQAIREESLRCREALPNRHLVYAYVDKGFYAEQIRRILRFFPREQCLFLKTEDLYDQHNKVLKQIFAFLGVEPNHPISEQEIKPNVTNKGIITTEITEKSQSLNYYHNISQADRQYLAQLYAPDLKQVEMLLDWDLTQWLKT